MQGYFDNTAYFETYVTIPQVLLPLDSIIRSFGKFQYRSDIIEWFLWLFLLYREIKKLKTHLIFNDYHIIIPHTSLETWGISKLNIEGILWACMGRCYPLAYFCQLNLCVTVWKGWTAIVQYNWDVNLMIQSGWQHSYCSIGFSNSFVSSFTNLNKKEHVQPWRNTI